MDWTAFFPPNTPVTALPSWSEPRLLVPARSMAEAWQRSRLFPAFSWPARVRKSLLRLAAATGARARKRTPANEWMLGSFLADVWPEAQSATVLLGSPSPTQKTTVEITGADGRPLGFVKIAEHEPAKERLRQERDVLAQLPEGAGPKLIKYGLLARSEALVTSALPGRPLPPDLPPAHTLIGYVRSLERSESYPVEAHPWIRTLPAGRGPVAKSIEALSGREWAVTVQHGDLVWNTFDAAGRLSACDWEYGTLDGFPGQDLANYVLQVGMERNGWSPERVRPIGVRFLQSAGYSEREAHALLDLAAFDVYLKFEADGYTPDRPEQQWRAFFWHMSSGT